MKNKMSDVRNHLVAMLEELGDRDASANTVERARATAIVASTFIAAVKLEVDARRLLGEFDTDLPPALDPPAETQPRSLNGPRK